MSIFRKWFSRKTTPSKLENIETIIAESIEDEVAFSIQSVTPIISADFTEGYPSAEAERGKFVVGDLDASVFSEYPSASGRGKYVMLTYDVNELDAVDFTQSYNTAEAERGKFVKLNLDSTETGYPSGGRGKYAVLTYNVNSSGTTNLSSALPLAGGTMTGDIDMGGNDITNVGLLSINGSTSITGCLSTDCIKPYTTITSPISVYSSIQMTASTNHIDLNDSQIQNTHSIGFDLDHAESPSKGELLWNNEDGTLDLGLGTPVLQIGQESHYYARNYTDSTITNGTVVQAVSAQQVGNSGTVLVAPATATGVFPSKFIMGVATENILAGGDGYVTQFGKVRGIDTTGLPAGTILYADPGTIGGLTSAQPVAPNNNVTMAIVLSENNNGTIFVRPTYGDTINEHEDVIISNVQDNDILIYSAASGLWINEPSSNIGGSATGYGITETKTSTFTVNTSSGIMLVDATAGNITVNLLPASSNDGRRFTVKKIDSSSNTITLSANTNIDSRPTFIINNPYDAIEFISNGTQWWII